MTVSQSIAKHGSIEAWASYEADVFMLELKSGKFHIEHPPNHGPYEDDNGFTPGELYLQSHPGLFEEQCKAVISSIDELN